MRRLLSVILGLMLVLSVSVTPVAAGESHLILYTGDSHTGSACQVYYYDTNFSNGLTNGVGATCGNNWDNTVESVYFHFHTTSTCYIFYTGTGYSGTAHVFHDTWEGWRELPGTSDNIFSSFRKGTQGAGSACIPQF